MLGGLRRGEESAAGQAKGQDSTAMTAEKANGLLHWSKEEETQMKLTNHEWLRAARWMGLLSAAVCLMGMVQGNAAQAQAVSTTTVQGTVYLANGQPGTGTLVVSWPSFTTASGLLVAADSATVAIAPDGFVSVNLAPNQGATPAGQYYTAVYYLSDGTTNTQYWVVPAAAQATLAQVQAQLMPAAQAVQTVSKTYVDQAIAELTGSLLTASGGTLSGPLTLCCDPTQPLGAADKHYVDETFALAVPLAGGSMTGALATPAVNGVESPVAGSSQTTLQGAMSAAGANGAMEISPAYAGTDGFTNPNGVYVTDLRQGSSQQFERSVKEFGAVCDGTTDDTNALQSALNYAQTHGVALTIPQGRCKTRTLTWHGESIGGMGKQVSALMGFPGRDVLLTVPDSANLLPYTRIHDLTIYVDQSLDASCSTAKGVAPAGSCAANRPMESNSIFSPGGNGLTGTTGTGAAWAVGNCAIAMPAATGAGGNGLKVAEIENLEIAATGVDPLAAQYPGAHSTHTCGLYLAQWPQWSEFRNIDIRGLNTGIAMPALPVTAPAGLNSDSNRWQNITIQATHGFTAEAGSNNVLDNVVAAVGNSAATNEPPTGLALNFAGTQQGWTVRNSVVLPVWNAVQPALTVMASGGAVTAVAVGSQAGLGFDPYGTQVPLTFSGSCTAQATASVTSAGAIGTVTVTQGGVGCSGTTTATVNVAGTWDTAAPVNLISGQSMTFNGGNLLKGNGGYTVWNAAGSTSYGTQLGGGGGNLPGGGTYAALVTNSPLGSAYQVDQFPGADFGAQLQACLGTLSASNGGTCDARNFTGTLQMGSTLTIGTANATVLLPCATISTANQIIVTAGTRNVSLRGCGLRGASTASGSQGGTVFLYSGTKAMVQVGDPTYAADTMGFQLDNAAINTTTATSGAAQGLIAYRTQEMYLESLYFLGNANQTGMTLDGTGNYTGGTFLDNQFNGFQTAVSAIGHQISNPATTDWTNASAFVRLHIDCPTSGGSPVSGTYGINLQQGDGNTFTGGDVEGCSTALHLGANAQNNTIVGLRNENSTNQVVADAGSSYNNWMTGGTMFTGQLTDNGTRNSFLDTFHRSFNGLNGDWYGSQKDATVTNHFRLGTGAGNERGLLDRYQTDYGYRWTMGLSDATAGEQYYQILDELNNVYRFSVGQYNNGQSSTNDQTVINAAGTGAVVLNGSNNAGTGGVVIGSGGASETTVATISNAGNAQFNGTLQVGGTTTFAGTPTVKNQADAEIDATLWAGLTASQKESFIYKDWNGNSQWFMVKDASNNWALNSAAGGLDSFKAYQSTNSGDTYVNASNSSGTVRVNYETGAGTGFKVYGGNSSSLYASFTGTNSIQFPGLAAGSGHNCLQIDNSGYITNTGSTCGSGGTSGTINTGTISAFAYYPGSGTTLSPLTPAQAWTSIFSSAGINASCALLTTDGSGGLTCSSYTPAGALAALGAQAALSGVSADSNNGVVVTGKVAANTIWSSAAPYDIRAYGADPTGTTNSSAAIQSAIAAAGATGAPATILIPQGTYLITAKLSDPYSNIKFKNEGGAFLCAMTSDYCFENGNVGAVSTLSLTNGGTTGYTTATGVSVASPNPLCSGVLVNITASGGAITAVAPNASGYGAGCVYGDILIPPGGDGTAYFTVTAVQNVYGSTGTILDGLKFIPGAQSNYAAIHDRGWQMTARDLGWLSNELTGTQGWASTFTVTTAGAGIPVNSADQYVGSTTMVTTTPLSTAVSSGCTGVTLAVTGVNSSGGLTAASVLLPGSNCTTGDTLTVNIGSTHPVVTVSVYGSFSALIQSEDDQGMTVSGLKQTSQVVTSNMLYVGAAIYAPAQAITGVKIASGGSSYSVGDYIFPTSNGAGFGAVLQVTSVLSGSITGVSILYGGNRYSVSASTAIPTWSVSSSGGTGATVYVIGNSGGDTTNAAVLWLDNDNFSMGCWGNPIDDEAGNDFHMLSSIGQSYSQFTLRFAGGADPSFLVSRMHSEAGACPNPALNGIYASSGYIVNGADMELHSGEAGGASAVFPVGGAVGTQNYGYYVVPHTTNFGQVIPIGYTTNANATLSATNFVTVTYPTIPTPAGQTTVTCDVLRVDQTVNGRAAPYLGNAFYVVQNQPCDTSIGPFVSFQDTTPDVSLGTYTQGFPAYPMFSPEINMWSAGGIVLSTESGGNYSTGNFSGDCGYQSQMIQTAPPGYYGAYGKTIACNGSFPDDYQGDVTPMTAGMFARLRGITGGTGSATSSFLWPLGLSSTVGNGTKGIFNFGYPGTSGYQPSPGPTDVLTIYDSNYAKTMATIGNRPIFDAGDSALCIDGAKYGLCFRDPVSHSWYINHIPDGTNWTGRLTASSLALTVPVTTTGVTNSGNETIGGTLGVTGNTTVQNITINGTCTGSGCAVPYSAYAAPASDILCAHGSDTTIDPVPIIGATNAVPIVFTIGSPYAEASGYVVGQRFTAQGQANSAYNGSYIITAIAQGFITANNSSAPGSAWTSGGSPTISMVCNNTTDAIFGNTAQFFSSSVNLPAYTAPASYGIQAQFSVFTPTTAPPMVGPNLYDNGVDITSISAGLAFTNRTDQGGSVKYTVTMPSLGVIYPTQDFQSLSTTTVYNNVAGVKYVSTSSPEPLTMTSYWTASGLGGTLMLSYSSGGTSCTNGTQAVTGFNGAGSNGAGTITVSGGVPTGSITWTNTGYGYTSIPTTGQVATCTGVTTFTNTGALGGAQGTALRLFWLRLLQQ
jgi:hypothetical protein